MKADANAPSLLIIEDETNFLGTLVMALERQYGVTSSPNWTDARSRLAETRFDAILLDLYLPDAGLLEPIEHIHGLDPDYPVVVMSGYLDINDATVERLMRLGVNTILHKPFPLERLHEGLAQALAHSNRPGNS